MRDLKYTGQRVEEVRNIISTSSKNKLRYIPVKSPRDAIPINIDKCRVLFTEADENFNDIYFAILNE